MQWRLSMPLPSTGLATDSGADALSTPVHGTRPLILGYVLVERRFQSASHLLHCRWFRWKFVDAGWGLGVGYQMCDGVSSEADCGVGV